MHEQEHNINDQAVSNLHSTCVIMPLVPPLDAEGLMTTLTPTTRNGEGVGCGILQEAAVGEPGPLMIPDAASVVQG